MTPIRFRDWNCLVVKRQYDNGRVALQLVDAEDGSPIAKATVNLPDVPLEVLSKVVDGGNEKGGVPLVKSV